MYLERKQGVPQGASRLHGDGVQGIRRQARPSRPLNATSHPPCDISVVAAMRFRA